MTAANAKSRVLGALLLAAAGALAACSGGGSDTTQVTAQPTDPITPVVRGADAGLEARFWVVENRPGVLAGAFGGFDAPRAEPNAHRAWTSNGIRVFAVPLDELDGVRESLPTVGPLHRQWMGLMPGWVEVVKGASLARERVVLLDNGPVSLGPGRFRLAARCWVSPSIGAEPDAPGARLTVELAPELLMDNPRNRSPLERVIDGESIASDRRDDIMQFDRLRLSIDAVRDHAIVIVPEQPGVNWSQPAEARPESDLDPEVVDSQFGPRFPSPLTLGEVMLTSRALPDSVGDARIVIVLVPRVPDRFELLSR